jgi:two-component system response regulator NreC
MLSMHGDPEHVRAAFHVGARGYVVKSAAPEELLTAIHEVLQGHFYLSPTVTGCLLRSLAGPRDDREADFQSHDGPSLTAREREVLALVSQGFSNRRIAARLCVFQATVRTHLSHLHAKLDRTNRVELALYTVRG